YVTVTDAIFGFLTTVDTFTVGTTGLAPVAFAGEDTALPCGQISMTLDGTGSSLGGQYTYSWTSTNGFVSPPGNTLTPTIVGAGEYINCVTDGSTGCTVCDTVMVAVAVAPAIELSVTDSITCVVDTVALIGTGSSAGSAFTYNWTGPAVVPGTETLLDAQATQSGTYFLTVTNNQSGCETMDSIVVTENTELPLTDAGADQMIDCLMASDTLDGTGSVAGADYTYEWLDPDMAFLSDQPTVIVSEAGTYQLNVTNTVTGCVGTDFVDVAGDQDLPVVDAGADQTITCAQDTVTLDGSGTTGGDLVFLWMGPGITGDATESVTTANVAGTYILTVTDTTNGCEAFSPVIVGTDFVQPFADAGEVQDLLNCNVDQVQLDGSSSSTGGPGEYTYMWTGPAVDAGETSLFPLVSGAGTYYIEVTNSANGCTALDSVLVESDEDLPTVAIQALNGTELNCAINTIQLDTVGTSQGAQYNYLWSGPFCINVSSLEVFCAGEFVLEVINTTNGCSATDTIVITENTATVVATADDATYTCFDDCFDLDGTGSSTGVDIVYAWTAGFGGVISAGANTLMPTICAPGSYALLVTDTVTGCTDDILVAVMADTMPPVADAGADGTINCYEDFVQLDGSNSTSTNVTYTWTLNGGFFSNAVMPIATDPGTYVLEVVSGDNGCSATDEVIVDENTTDPVANAGPTQELGCGDDSVVLDGSGSSAGPNIIYLWEAISGVLDANTTTLQSAIANEVGTYMLTVQDTVNGCTATAEVEVISVIDYDLALASIMGDACEINAVLEGNLPDGTTGAWTTTSTASIQDPTGEITPVEGLQTGLNSFTWTLSAPDCPDYSSATVEIDVEGLPTANNDLLEVNENLDSININVLNNDLLNGVIDYTITIIGGPEFGTISELKDGEFTYYLSPIFNGEIIIDYIICNDNCPDLCDTAFVQINIDRDIELEDEVPNGITPNGDGVNDELIFDILLIDPDLRENSEILIFNRWGDIVYTASPYNNDWTGTNQTGGDLPSGTYYYILRMDIGDGKIIKGDVTIMR
ncbi:MAG: gliding motility-associated C-terminal domain-containing protein, partial [Phaeodactylibacter sp.]|nr:gliding motility-associated C-terminal domain-containing protein [Phaeodactylibacter sp.]